VTLAVLVQGVPDRGEAWHRSRESIERSDVGSAYEVLLQPSYWTIGEHFLRVLRRALECPGDLVIRLEDDAIVNEHLLHNVATWPEAELPDFGAGWLFCPVQPPPRGRWPRREIHGSVGVVLRKQFLPAIIKRCESDFLLDPARTDQDLVLSRAVFDCGLRVYLHIPALVEHPIDVPSSLDHRHSIASGTTSGRFRANWRR
jgi:hypothetical protein